MLQQEGKPQVLPSCPLSWKSVTVLCPADTLEAGVVAPPCYTSTYGADASSKSRGRTRLLNPIFRLGDSNNGIQRAESSVVSESAMNDTEQSCAQLLRDVEEARLQIPKDLAVLVLWKQEIKDLQNALQKLEDSLEMHQGNARQIGFSKSG